MGLWFQKKTELDLSQLVIDCHNHILYGVDDGCQTEEESYIVLDYMIHTLNYQTIVFSPHIMKNGFDNTSDDLKTHFEQWLPRLESRYPRIAFGLWAEYFMDENFQSLSKQKNLLTWHKNHILVETAMNYEDMNCQHLLYDLLMSGYQPILAHPERYTYWNKQLDTLEHLKEMGVKLQLNLFSLEGLYGNSVKKWAEEILSNNLYDIAASDIHNSRQVDFFSTLKKNSKLSQYFDTIQNSILCSK